MGGKRIMATDILRRDVLKYGVASATGAALAIFGGRSAAAAEKVVSSSPTAAKMGWQIGVEQYTFRRFTLYEMLDMMVTLGIEHAEGAFFLPLDKARPELKTNEELSPPVRKELKQRMADRGISMSTFYGDLGTDHEQARKIFEFCSDVGAGMVVAEPPAAAIDMIEKLCDEYHINLAIHNHPKSPQSMYWSPEKVLAACNGHGKRIGACCDTGHWVRSGLDPVDCLTQLEGRVLGLHLKDVAEKGKPESRDVPLGKGAANYAAVMRELKRQGFRGVAVVEYEYDSDALMADVAQCVAFIEKTAQAMRG
jgi:sugar phosphate isomerase/epimerase